MERHPYYDEPATDEERSYLEAFSNRLVQFMGPTPMAAEYPDSVPYRMAMKRLGRRDELICSLDPDRMSHAGWMSLRTAIVKSKRTGILRERYPNLLPLIGRSAATPLDRARRRARWVVEDVETLVARAPEPALEELRELVAEWFVRHGLVKDQPDEPLWLDPALQAEACRCQRCQARFENPIE